MSIMASRELQLASIGDPASCKLQGRLSPGPLESSIAKKPGMVLAVTTYKVSRSDSMADIIFILVVVLFFAISWWYAIGCDRL